jgi:hypothetical protein
MNSKKTIVAPPRRREARPLSHQARPDRQPEPSINASKEQFCRGRRHKNRKRGNARAPVGDVHAADGGRRTTARDVSLCSITESDIATFGPVYTGGGWSTLMPAASEGARRLGVRGMAMVYEALMMVRRVDLGRYSVFRGGIGCRDAQADSQEQVYAAVQAKLDSAIVDPKAGGTNAGRAP